LSLQPDRHLSRAAIGPGEIRDRQKIQFFSARGFSCRALDHGFSGKNDDGPLLWLWLSSGGIFGNPPEDVSKPRDKNAQAPENMDAALARAGMSYDVYQLYLGALSMAKSDAADPRPWR